MVSGCSRGRRWKARKGKSDYTTVARKHQIGAVDARLCLRSTNVDQPVFTCLSDGQSKNNVREGLDDSGRLRGATWIAESLQHRRQQTFDEMKQWPIDRSPSERASQRGESEDAYQVPTSKPMVFDFGDMLQQPGTRSCGRRVSERTR